MTLQEAMDYTINPVRDMFLSAANYLDKEDGEQFINVIESKGNLDEKINANIARLAFINQPDHEMYEKTIATIKRNNKKNKNVFTAYGQIIPNLIKYIEELKLQIYGWKYISEQFLKSNENNNKRWGKEEDDELIEMACNDMPEIVMAARFGRTPSAIKTRITYLVGVKRISQQVAGKFIGTANGSEFEADLVGTVYKE